MNKLALVAALALSSAAFAAPARNATATGQFRRAEAIKAAGADPKTAQVINLTTANHRLIAQTSQPADARILFVTSDKKVTIVNAPLDKSQAVTKLGAREANKLGLVTQAQAKKLATTNGGLLGGKGKIELVADGMGAKRGSYRFAQTSPASLTVKQYGETYDESQITRMVSVTGKGESARAGNWQSVTTPPVATVAAK